MRAKWVFIFTISAFLFGLSESAFALTEVEELENILNGKDKSIQSKEPVRSLSEFLGRLREKGEMPEGFLSIFKSNASGSHNMSRENPRILLRWKNTVLGFNGSSEDLETMTFNNETKKFELRYYTLGEPGKKGQHQSEKNPKKCLLCHANSAGDPAPIYDGYNTWPGYYGTNDGQIQGKEWRDYRNFKVKNRIFDIRNSRRARPTAGNAYSYLIDWDQKRRFEYVDPNGRRTLDHYIPDNCNPKVLGGVSLPQRTAGPGKEDIRYRFVDFGRFLYAKHQDYVIQNKIFGTPLEPFRYAILGGALCPSADFDEKSFLTPRFRDQADDFSFDELVQETRDIAAASYAHKVSGVHRDLGGDKDRNGRGGRALDREGAPIPGKVLYDQDLRRLEGFKALDGQGRTGPYSAGFKGSAETYGIYARVRLIVEKVAGQKMDWSMSRKALKSEYEDEEAWKAKFRRHPNPAMRVLPPLQKLNKWKNARRDQQVSGPEDYSFGQGCFDFERPESWISILETKHGSADDQQADRALLTLLKDAMINVRPQNGLDKYGGYILSDERQAFCNALQGRSKMVLMEHEKNLRKNDPAVCLVEPAGSRYFNRMQSMKYSLQNTVESNEPVGDEAHTQEFESRGRKYNLHLEKKGLLHRSINIPRVGKIQFYKDEAAIAVQHLKKNDPPSLSYDTKRCKISSCVQLVYSNGESVTLSREDAKKFMKFSTRPDSYDPLPLAGSEVQRSPIRTNTSQ